MSTPAAVLKQVQIKSGVVKRLLKEHNLYKKEAEQQKQKLDKLIADGAEEWDIKNGTRMMEEADRMITDSADRLEKSTADLRDLVARAKENSALSQDEQLLSAEEVLKTADP